MDATAARAVLLLCTVASSAGSFYYQSAYQEPLPLQLQQVQQVYRVLPQPFPLAVLPYPYTPIAAPSFPIYSDPQPSQARALLGYSYQIQDIDGARSQVLYVAGPNSQQLFQQNAAPLFMYAINVDHVDKAQNNSKSKTPEEVPDPSIDLRGDNNEENEAAEDSTTEKAEAVESDSAVAVESSTQTSSSLSQSEKMVEENSTASTEESQESTTRIGNDGE